MQGDVSEAAPVACGMVHSSPWGAGLPSLLMGKELSPKAEPA